MLIKGERPRHTGLRAEAREQCGWPVFYRIMQACWVSPVAERPSAAHVLEALELAKSYVANATPEQTAEEIAALEAEAEAQSEAQSGSGASGAAASAYDAFLSMVGLLDRRAELDEYIDDFDTLMQYDEEELDEDVLDELGLDDDMKAAFHQKVRELKPTAAPCAQQASEFDPDVVDAAAQAAAEHEAQWPKWPALQKTLPGLSGLRGLHAAEAQTLQDALRRLRAKDVELAAKSAREEELAATVAAQDEELRQLRAQLGRLEGVPPQ